MCHVLFAADVLHRADIGRLMQGFSLETTPGAAAKVADFRTLARRGTPIYITFLPGSDIRDTISVAKRLRHEGFEPMPHFAARSLASRAVFEDAVKAMVSEAGVSQALVIAGAVPRPLGEYSDAMQLLETGILDRHGIGRIGVAAHPEGSPDIPDEAIRHALKWKNAFAQRTGARVHLVTQFCFEAEPLIRWDKAIQAEGNRLPVRVGVPGLATVKTLLMHARTCGIGASMRFITKQAMNVAKLLTVSAPDRLVADLAEYRTNDPKCGIEGVHMYPLGGFAKTAAWSYAVADGKFMLRPEGGFNVLAPA